MFKTKRTDWYFIVPASLIWISAIIVTTWDFVQVQKTIYHFGFINIIGLSSMLIGVLIRIRARQTLGRYFSYGLRTLGKHKLVKYDIYKYIRHPAYLGSFLFSFGIPLLFSSLYGFLIMLLLVPFFLYRIKIEENVLIEKFGNKYCEYTKSSKKLIPYIY
ncbi:MAG: methyltransferase family protein [Candidatus Hydrothermarchaeaceae archaeon]